MAATGGYYINTVEGTIQRQTNPLLAEALKVAGFIGPFATPAAAQAALGKDLAGKATSLPTDATEGAASGIINFIKQGSIWERGAEVIIGILVLYIGLKAIATPGGASAGARGVKDTASSLGSALKGTGTTSKPAKKPASSSSPPKVPSQPQPMPEYRNPVSGSRTKPRSYADRRQDQSRRALAAFEKRRAARHVEEAIVVAPK
jgi:hypothetical protein